MDTQAQIQQISDLLHATNMRPTALCALLGLPVNTLTRAFFGHSSPRPAVLTQMRDTLLEVQNLCTEIKASSGVHVDLRNVTSLKSALQQRRQRLAEEAAAEKSK
jgi:hypothetical protein